jgi:ABC-type Fe3+-citrate transport system substrate-binding protein
MSSNEKARDGLFRELFAKQLEIVAVEAQITTQPLDYLNSFDQLAEVGNKTAALHRELAEHQRYVSDLRTKMKLEEASN